jgi:hypothetical protein
MAHWFLHPALLSKHGLVPLIDVDDDSGDSGEGGGTLGRESRRISIFHLNKSLHHEEMLVVLGVTEGLDMQKVIQLIGKV